MDVITLKWTEQIFYSASYAKQLQLKASNWHKGQHLMHITTCLLAAMAHSSKTNSCQKFAKASVPFFVFPENVVGF